MSPGLFQQNCPTISIEPRTNLSTHLLEILIQHKTFLHQLDRNISPPDPIPHLEHLTSPVPITTIEHPNMVCAVRPPTALFQNPLPITLFQQEVQTQHP